ncbi:conjugal transfer protein TraG N-terminal domain-containing protein [Denitratimonas sp. CY0512]|uniref:conjugal transfer protein TraG N-terminal domain-containing protein n=1 Tax=Denitratimonas sp. CY0512 TaxID=3131940 RepID=UPI0030A0F072
MGVFSYAELYTTIVGWTLYGLVWELLTLTGIAWIPFLIAIYQNTREPMEAQESRDATQVSIRRMFWSLGVMVLVVAFCVVPTTGINVSTVTFTCPPTLGNPSAACVSGVSYGSTGTGYDAAPMPGMAGGAAGSTIKLPIFWAGLSSISGGFINAMVSGLPQRAGLRELQSVAAAANIIDPNLSSQVQRFTRECYIPAMNKMEGWKAGVGTSNHQGVMQMLEGNAIGSNRSMDYIGNSLLRSTVGLYVPCPNPDFCGNTLKASAPVPGYEGDGRPNCDEWWNDLRNGKPDLHHGLVEEAARNMSGGTKSKGEVLAGIQGAVMGAAQWAGFNIDMSGGIDEDMLVHMAAGNLVHTASSRADRAISAGLTAADHAFKWINPLNPGGLSSLINMENVRSVGQTYGLASEKFSLSIKMPLIMKAAPLVQSILIMVIIALVPIVMVIGRYSLSTLMVCGIGYFTVRFWTVLWAIAAWADELLFALFASNQSLIETGSFGPNDASISFARYAMQLSEYQMSSVVELTTVMLYLGMPAIFSMLLGWAGVVGINGLNEGMKGMMSSTESAGNRADQGVRSAAGAAAIAAAAPVAAATGGVGGAVIGTAARGASDIIRK